MTSNRRPVRTEVVIHNRNLAVRLSGFHFDAGGREGEARENEEDCQGSRRR